MKQSLLVILAIIGSCVFLVLPSQAGELAQRRDMQPLSRAKVNSVMAKGNRDNAAIYNKGHDVTSVMNKGLGNKKAECITNIGVVNDTDDKQTKRYGPSNKSKNRNDEVIAIKGDIISVCK